MCKCNIYCDILTVDASYFQPKWLTEPKIVIVLTRAAHWMTY